MQICAKICYKRHDKTLAGLVLRFVCVAHDDYSFSTRSAPQFYECTSSAERALHVSRLSKRILFLHQTTTRRSVPPRVDARPHCMLFFRQTSTPMPKADVATMMRTLSVMKAS